MHIEYKEFVIELLDEEGYSTKSADSIRNYKFEYSKGEAFEKGGYSPTTKHGIRVIDKRKDEEISSAIINENGGATTIHSKCYFVKNDKIWICVCDKIYCLNLPGLEIEWYGRFDYVTNFSIHPFKEDFLIHGELEIMRINQKGEFVWRFGGKDIFVTRRGDESFQVEGDRIKVKDWGGVEYVLDENGNEVK